LDQPGIRDEIGSAPPRRILHVDCDAFFVQVARLADPEGAGRADLLIVGGTPSGRGVVTSASYEARAYGVRSAMPTARALRLCPRATVVSVPRGEISRKSGEVRRALEDLAPVVEAASVDEFYLDLTGTERLFAPETLTDTAERIRRAVLERTVISTSVGGGSNRLIAKMATSCAKPAGVHVVPPGGEAAFLESRSLSDIPGVGPSLLEALAKRGLHTVKEALAVQPEWLERWFGARRGAWLHARLRGRAGSDVDAELGRKSISSERTFFQDIDDDGALDAALLRLTDTVATTLRHKSLRARTVGVKIRDFDFRTRQRTRTLPEAVESERAVRDVARALLRDLRAARPVPVRLLGIGLGTLEDADAPRQLGLFGEPVAGETERERGLSRVVDEVRGRFGPDAVVAARLVGTRSGRPSPSSPRPASDES